MTCPSMTGRIIERTYAYDIGEPFTAFDILDLFDKDRGKYPDIMKILAVLRGAPNIERLPRPRRDLPQLWRRIY